MAMTRTSAEPAAFCHFQEFLEVCCPSLNRLGRDTEFEILPVLLSMKGGGEPQKVKAINTLVHTLILIHTNQR